MPKACDRSVKMKSMITLDFCRAMPKVELHVHLEGSIRPETVLALAEKNDVRLPANTLDGLKEWYRFTGFPHFVDVYTTVSGCIRTAEDIEFIAREFLEGQKEQNILHTEATYTALTMRRLASIPFDDQMQALARAARYGQDELGVSLGLILDFTRETDPEDGIQIAELAVEWADRGVAALGLSGFEGVGGAAAHQEAFAIAKRAGLPIVPHCGETEGADSIWEALELCDPPRIGHGVRCLEDRDLVDELKRRDIVLEVCPSSNVCLGGSDSIESHPVNRLVEDGLTVTINSDDPPMFGSTLSEEFYKCAIAFGWDESTVKGLARNAAERALVSISKREWLSSQMTSRC